MFDELWQEIQDMPGEIFDIPDVIEPYKVVHGRVFETKEEYDQAIHDFLNENWLCNFKSPTLTSIVVLMKTSLMKVQTLQITGLRVIESAPKKNLLKNTLGESWR